MQISIEVNNLCKTYTDLDHPVLNDISFEVNRGGFYAIMGSSGSGKSTLLNVIGGIDKFDSGEIIIEGIRLSALTRDEMAEFRLNNVGIVYQDYNLIDCLTLRENIALPLHNADLSPTSYEDMTGRISEKMGIRHILDRYPYEVSGGEQQRAAICRAIINEPKIILADEPTGNLDSKSSTAVMQCFEKLNKNDDITILMVTHDLYTASYCEKVVMFRDGMIEDVLERKNKKRKEFYKFILNSMEIRELYE